jgi:prepilin signal peptidase PulO-like enzyme (type II secretory pathway)
MRGANLNKNPIGTAAGTLGIIGIVLSLIFSWIPGLNAIPIVLSVLAVILGGVGIHRASRQGRVKGMAVTGLVTGLLTLLWNILWIAFLAAVLGAASAS